jgi:hypothetical protein
MIKTEHTSSIAELRTNSQNERTTTESNYQPIHQELPLREGEQLLEGGVTYRPGQWGVNGELTDPVVPSRGIRQGDPISPYLFLLCTEGLSCLLQKREAQGELQGIRNGRLGPPISHLLFADDSIFFTRSDRKSVEALHNTLEVYCAGSGQKINKDKSNIFFGANCSE